MNIAIKDKSTDPTGVTNPLSKVQNPSLSQSDALGTQTKRGKLVGLLRGYFASPVIAALGEMGMTERMLEGDFSVADWDSVPHRDIISALFRYLYSIGLLTRGTTGDYALTPEGRTSLGRNGAFSLLMSYAEYFSELPATLAGKETTPSVNRRRNVYGSGQLHSRKFFPAAFDLLSSEMLAAIIDIGCGDGRFLALAREQWPGIVTIGVDLSETAVAETKRRFDAMNESGLLAVIANGSDVPTWSAAVPDSIWRSSQLVISMWFVAHEFSEGSLETIVTFFSELQAKFPEALVLLGEINNIPAEVLAEDHELSIMPEFLLFHDLSGQGVLSWDMWLKALTQIPYVLKGERQFDEVRSTSGKAIPASFLWLLEPKAPICALSSLSDSTTIFG